MRCTLGHYLRILGIHELSGLSFDSVFQPELSRGSCGDTPELPRYFFSCFSLRHDEAREILLDQVMDCFIYSGLSRANGMPGSLKEETHCCFRKCRQDGLVVRSCNHLFFLVKRGGEFQVIRVMMKIAKNTVQVYCFIPH